MTKEKLKPCPFCGGKGAIDYIETPEGKMVYWIYCQHCTAAGPGRASAEPASREWNRRVEK